MKEDEVSEINFIVKFFKTVLETKRVKKIQSQVGDKQYQTAIEQLKEYIHKGKLK